MHRMVLLLTVSLMLVPVPILASQVTVPDDYATIQAAWDSRADTVFVRGGKYPEALQLGHEMSWTRSLLALPADLWYGPVANPPVVASITTANYSIKHLRGLVSTGPASVWGGLIEGCWFGAGLQLGLGGTTVWNNMVFGNIVASGGAAFNICMNTVIGGRIEGNPVGDCQIRRNVVLGPAATGIMAWSDVSAIENYVRGCGVGIHVSGEFSGASGNVVEDCSGTGILAEAPPSTWWGVGDNTVRRCGGDGVSVASGALTSVITGNTVDSVGGAGIRTQGPGAEVTGNVVTRAVGRGLDISSGFLTTMLDNQVVGAGADGAVVSGQIVQVRGNVVGRSGGRGLAVTGEEVTVRANTLYLNADAGLDLSGTSSAGVDSVDHNIAYQNDVGLRWDGLGTAVLGCNDWYANTTANTEGISPGATDLSLNPLFCDMMADDVSLSAVSALLDPPGCGLVGALGEGCPYPVAVPPEPGAVLSGLGVLPQPGRGEVRLSWQGTNDVTEVAIYDVTGARRWSATAAPGASEVVWRGVDDDGRPLPAGVYFAKVGSGERQAAANVVLVR